MEFSTLHDLKSPCPPVQSPDGSCEEKTGPAGLDFYQVADLAAAFARVPDPRSRRGRRHPLTAILLVAACAVTCAADGFTAIWQWADDVPAHVLTPVARVRRSVHRDTPAAV